MRRDFQKLHDTLPVVFINKNDSGAPQLFQHQCSSERRGLPVTDEELMDFGLDLLDDLYSNIGMSVRHGKIGEQNYLVLESKGKVFYVVVKVDRYPVNPLNIDETGCEEIINLAEENHAEAKFAPLSFSCFSNATSVHDLADKNKAITGGSYACAFRGLINLGNY